MTLRRVVGLLGVAAVTGLVVGMAFSGDEVVSVEIWIGASIVTMVAALTRKLLAVASIERASLSPAWVLAPVSQPAAGARGMRSIQSLVTSAQSHPKAFTHHLRPHLAAVAEHYLPRRHGLDMDRDIVKIASLLGEVGWLIDSSVDDRVPTASELEKFLTIVVGDETNRSSEIPTESRSVT